MRFPAAALAVLCALAAAAGEPRPAATAGKGRTLRVPVNVAGETALRPSELEVVTGTGSTARVTAVQNPASDLVLILVLDLTGDIALAGPARSALAASLRELPPSTWVAVLRAQDGGEVLLDPTPDRAKAEQVITSAPISGKAGLLTSVETVVTLADHIASRSSARVAVVYITDSDVRNYREDFTNPVINSSDSRDLSRRFPEGLVRERLSKVTEVLLTGQTPVFITHLQYSAERLNQAYQSGLLQIASATGGAAEFCRSQAEIRDAVLRTVKGAQNQYSVKVQLPAGGARDVTLTLRSGDLPLSYRSRFRAQ